MNSAHPIRVPFKPLYRPMSILPSCFACFEFWQIFIVVVIRLTKPISVQVHIYRPIVSYDLLFKWLQFEIDFTDSILFYCVSKIFRYYCFVASSMDWNHMCFFNDFHSYQHSIVAHYSLIQLKKSFNKCSKRVKMFCTILIFNNIQHSTFTTFIHILHLVLISVVVLWTTFHIERKLQKRIWTSLVFFEFWVLICTIQRPFAKGGLLKK